MNTIMKKLFVYFLLTITFLLLHSCSATPVSWFDTLDVSNASVDTASFNVTVSGYPPFTFEVYDNNIFEGEALGEIEVGDVGSFDLMTLPAVKAFSLDLGSPLYLRVKSQYGDWEIYEAADGTPEIFVPVNISVPKGDSTRPYLISSKEDLIALSDRDTIRYDGIDPWLSSFILTNDIDLTGVVWQPIGGGTPNEFQGTFKGEGHIISGFDQLDISLSDKNAGFFGVAVDATIDNLGLKMGYISCDDAHHFGGLVGWFGGTGSGVINECYVIGEGINGGTFATGGLVGSLQASTVKNCYTNLSVEGVSYIGGLVGFSHDSNVIQNSFASGDMVYVEGASYSGNLGYLGGFIGSTNSSSSNPDQCVALNSLMKNISGLTGTFHYFGISTHSSPSQTYYNKNVSAPEGTTSLFGGSVYSIPLNPYTMNQNTSPFNSWDFDNIWKWDNATNRPILRKVRL